MDKEYICTPKLHDRLEETRNKLGLSQRAMSIELGYGESHYGALESHRETEIPERIIKVICATYGVRYNYLVYGEEPMFVEPDAHVRKMVSDYNEMTPFFQGLVRELVDHISVVNTKMAEEGRRRKEP